MEASLEVVYVSSLCYFFPSFLFCVLKLFGMSVEGRKLEP